MLSKPELKVITNEWIDRLFLRFSDVYGHVWNSQASTPDDWERKKKTWFDALVNFPPGVISKSVRECLIKYREFPPTLNSFEDICLKNSGIPSMNEVANLAIKREFSHPLVKIIFDEIGSWEISRAKETDLHKKIKDLYPAALCAYRIEPEKYDNELLAYNENLKQLALDKYFGSAKEIKNKYTFSDMLEKSKSMPSQDEGKPLEQIYDEIRRAREAEGMMQYRHHQANRVSPPEQQQDTKRSYDKQRHAYKNWI